MNNEAILFTDSEGGLDDVVTAFDLMEPPAWHEQAACKGMGTDLFFSDRPEKITAAKAICATCPVQSQCQEWALDNIERNGVWGGASERQRRRMRRSWRRQPAQCGTDSGYYRHLRVTNTPPCAECKKAHSAATTKRGQTKLTRWESKRLNELSMAGVPVRKQRVLRLIQQGWCGACAKGTHADHRASGCACTVCNTFAQLPAHDSVKGRLGDDMSTTSVAGVENGKGDPLGDQLEEAG